MNTKPLILVTNDDGITAPGIRFLVECAKQFGEVVVVAPDSPQSGQGHAVTLTEPLRLHRVNQFDNVEAYECTGTPADCVKLAKHVIFQDRTPDLCLSGVNHGSNSSVNILYSGTMSAAMEASLEGIASIGFSLCDYSWEADFEPARPYVMRLIEAVLTQGMKDTNLLNVNIPKCTAEALKGIRVCRQAEGYWSEDFIEGEDPSGRPYYWLKGKFTSLEQSEDTDIWALEHNYISVVPSMHDLTAHKALPQLRHMECGTLSE